MNSQRAQLFFYKAVETSNIPGKGLLRNVAKGTIE